MTRHDPRGDTSTAHISKIPEPQISFLSSSLHIKAGVLVITLLKTYRSHHFTFGLWAACLFFSEGFLCTLQRRPRSFRQIQNSVFNSSPANVEEQHLPRTIDPRRLDKRFHDPSTESPVFAQEIQATHNPISTPSIQNDASASNPLQESFPSSPSIDSSLNAVVQRPLEGHQGPQGPPKPPYTCNSCHNSFDKHHQLNTHRKSHTLPFKCTALHCVSKGFRYNKDLERHLRERHRDSVTNAHRFYCPHPSCKFSLGGIKPGFSRPDHYRRHMEKLHPDTKTGQDN
ncbi:hypothetical protein V496_05745 [Pseudogymnoascus sp. VKM F-4515 (FW-2607)]|nr:hypothetical protein V496_05745 [Pseudogymnoascus sp. VKM F-4515 (FW-2607)]